MRLASDEQQFASSLRLDQQRLAADQAANQSQMQQASNEARRTQLTNQFLGEILAQPADQRMAYYQRYAQGAAASGVDLAYVLQAIGQIPY